MTEIIMGNVAGLRAEMDRLTAENEQLRAELANAVKVRSLEWVDDHGEGYRIFHAITPVGRFAFGTDKSGQSYWQGNSPMSLGEDVASEVEAEEKAQAAYAAAIMETDAFKCLDIAPIALRALSGES